MNPNFKVITSREEVIKLVSGSTSLQGYIDVSYDKLVQTFGQPTAGYDTYKSDAEWIILFEDGTIATIYNYKDGKNYLGEEGTPTEKIRHWHIGGKENQQAVDLVANLLDARITYRGR